MSVIRRKHTANFTTIGNVLFNDERLTADELGILAFLLSRPDDWEVRRPALMRRFKIGRDAMKRIMTKWIRLGWCRAQKTRLANGTFHIVYEIRDEPGQELTEEDARNALSLVSSEASDAESEGDVAAEQGGDSDPPPTPQPGVDDQWVETPPLALKDSIKTDSVNTETPTGARAFDEVKAAWRPDKMVSAFAAEKAYVELTDPLKLACWNGIKPYLSDCDAQGRKVCDLTTYIRERRWEKFAAKAAAKVWTAEAGTVHWHRWHEYRIATGQSVAFMEAQAKQGKGWTTPTEWPPAMPAKEPIPIEGPPKEKDDAA